MSAASFDLSLWPEIANHLDRALDLDPSQRERWLSELTATQPHIAPILRELLAERDALNHSDFLQVPLVDPATRAALPHGSLAGKRIGAYTVERLIGRGGMGEVWLASRSDGLFEGRCAIKLVDSLGVRSALADRFHREGRLLARLGHPNIARLLDAGTTAEGRQFLVLEYIDGERIDHYCDSLQLTTQERVRLFLDAVSAVAHAHSHLIIHRDLKPSNVLVTRDGVIKLLDFGIAKLLGPEQRLMDETMTRIGELPLTPEYAAPEQLLGEVPCTATDVYQLGMLLYMLLAGGHPLQLLNGRAERIKAAMTGQMPRASQFASGALGKTLRGDLDAILEMALHTDPAQRYPTAAALREDLVRYLNREPVSARRGGGLYQARKFIARHRLVVMSCAAAAASLCATLVFALNQAQLAATEHDHAIALASRHAMVMELTGMVLMEAAEADKPVTVIELLERSEQLALADARDTPENRAAVLEMIAARYVSLGEFGRGARLLERALAILGNSRDTTLRSRLNCGRTRALANMGPEGLAGCTTNRGARAAT